MSNQEHFKFSNGVIVYPVLFVLLIWIVFWFEVRFGHNFTSYGVYPQKLKGLKGIIFSPFIHGDIKHLYHNTIPLFILSSALFYFYFCQKLLLMKPQNFLPGKIFAAIYLISLIAVIFWIFMDS